MYSEPVKGSFLGADSSFAVVLLMGVLLSAARAGGVWLPGNRHEAAMHVAAMLEIAVPRLGWRISWRS